MPRATVIRFIATGVIVAGFCFFAQPAKAVHINAAPSISLEGRWDSNIFSSSSDEESDFILRARPGVTLFLEAFRTTAKLSGGFEVERYADHDELDDETATTDIGLSVSEPFRLSPRFSFLPSAGYIETRDSSRRNQLLPEPTPGVPATETIVTERTKTKNYRASLRLLYLLTPLVDVSLGGGWSRRDFVGTALDVDGEDSTTVSGDFSFSYRLTPLISTGVFFNTSRNTFERSPSSRTYAGGLTGTYKLTQYYSLEVRAGASYFKEEAGVSAPENTEWSPYGGLALKYTWQYFQASINGSYEHAGGSSFGGTTRRGTVYLRMTNQFAERWWWDLSGSYQINRSVDEQESEDINTTEGAAGIRYAMSEWASFRLKGEILRQRSDGLSGSDIDRESVFLIMDLSTVYRLF